MLGLVLKLDLAAATQEPDEDQTSCTVCCQVYLHVYDLPGHMPKLTDVRGYQGLCNLGSQPTDAQIWKDSSS